MEKQLTSRQYFTQAFNDKQQKKDAVKLSALEIALNKEQKSSNDFRSKIAGDINNIAERVSENNDIISKTLLLQSRILETLQQIQMGTNTDNINMPDIPGLSKMKELKGVAKISAVTAAAAIVALGLYRMASSDAKENFNKSEAAGEQLSTTRRKGLEASGDIPSPASPEVQKLDKQQVTNLIMNYGLSGDKLNSWITQWSIIKEKQSEATATPVAPETTNTPKPSSGTNTSSVPSSTATPVAAGDTSGRMITPEQSAPVTSDAEQMLSPSPMSQRGYVKQQDRSINATKISFDYNDIKKKKSSNELKFSATNILFLADDFQFKIRNAPSEQIAALRQPVALKQDAVLSPMAPTEQPQQSLTTDPLAAAVNNTPIPEQAPPVTSSDFIRPVDDTVTSPFGMRGTGDHKGVDFGSKMGTPVKAATAGTIITAKTGDNGGYGNLVAIRAEDGTETRYAHLSSINVQPGQQVRAGEIVGQSGNTGKSTGPHLHFEVIKNGQQVDPAQYVSSSNKNPDAERVSNAPAAPDITSNPNPVSTPTTGAELVTTSNTRGLQTVQASQMNEVATMAASAPNINVIQPVEEAPMQTEKGIGAIQTPIDPNDPGNVEPFDSAVRYQKLFGMSAFNLAA